VSYFRFAFVDLHNERDAQKVVSDLNNTVFKGRDLKCRPGYKKGKLDILTYYIPVPLCLFERTDGTCSHCNNNVIKSANSTEWTSAIIVPW
jgi:RNA recognition motif-containing protein